MQGNLHVQFLRGRVSERKHGYPLNQPGHVERSHLCEQVRELGLEQEEAIMLGGRLYRDAIGGRFVVDQITSRLPGAGILYQIQWLMEHWGQSP